MESVKRRRVEVACSSCRSKKGKCDGLRPSCSRCLRERLQCHYEGTSQRHTGRPNRNVALEARVAQLERELADHHSATLSQRRSPTVEEHQQSRTPTTRPDHPRLTPQQHHEQISTSALVEEEALVDTLATATFSHETEIGIGHFGTSSNHGYFRILSGIFAQLPGDGHVVDPKSLHRWSQERASTEFGFPVHHVPLISCNISDVPDEVTATLYFQRFFAAMLLAMPFVSQSVVMQRYTQAKDQGFRQLDVVRRALFNIIWACGASFCVHEIAEVFYRRAMGLLSSVNIRQSGEEMVQLLILICSFQQNNQRSVASWTFHALAVKAAFQMGLHYPPTYENLGAEDCHKRQMLWFGVLNHDRFLATALGRPCLIPRQHARIVVPTSMTLSGWIDTESERPQAADLILYESTFYDIMASIVELLYDHNIEQPTISADDLLLRRMQLHLRLEAWKSSLPLSWKTVSLAEIEHNSSIELELIRVPILFSIHYRRAQLLINRPVLTHALRTWVLAAIPLSTVFTGELVTIANADFEAAKELVGIIHVLMLTDNDIVQRHGIWFLANYSVFAACTHLFGILLSCTAQPIILVAAKINREDIRACLQHSLEVLQNVGRKSLMSSKGAACILRFLDVLDAFDVSIPETRNTDKQDANVLLGLAADISACPAMGSMSDYIVQASDDFFLSSSFMTFGHDDFSRCLDATFSI